VSGLPGVHDRPDVEGTSHVLAPGASHRDPLFRWHRHHRLHRAAKCRVVARRDEVAADPIDHRVPAPAYVRRDDRERARGRFEKY